MEKPAKIRDVAKAAGVSTATVSRALSNPELLTERTRNAVFEAVRKTGYRVNQAARNLRKQQSGAVLVLVPDLSNPFFSTILSGINSKMTASEYSVLVADSSVPDPDTPLSSYFLNARVDGMISLDGALTQEELNGFGTNSANRIVFACEWVHNAEFASVRSDNMHGARMAIQHLHALGHRNIGYVSGPSQNVLTQVRLRGVLEEMASLTMAFGLISGLREHGIRVPDDISVMGFDDIELAEHFIPALTTIKQDRHMLGKRAADHLLARLSQEKQPLAPLIELVEVELVNRASTRPI